MALVGASGRAAAEEFSYQAIGFRVQTLNNDYAYTLSHLLRAYPTKTPVNRFLSYWIALFMECDSFLG